MYLRCMFCTRRPTLETSNDPSLRRPTGTAPSIMRADRLMCSPPAWVPSVAHPATGDVVVSPSPALGKVRCTSSGRLTCH